MITCQKCAKENQDHYKFCLGCGAELVREEAPKAHAPSPKPANVAESTHASAGVQAPPPPPPAGAGATAVVAEAPPPPPPQVERPIAMPPVVSSQPSNGASVSGSCPQCGHSNPASNRFCASCGYKLNVASVPIKPGGPNLAPAGSAESIRLTALRADGSEAGSYTLGGGPSETVGRDTGSIFAGDIYLSPRHATFSRRGERLYISDAGSLNGVYLKVAPNSQWPLSFGDVFRIGQEILRLEKLEAPQPSPDGVKRLGSPAEGYVARLGLVIGRDTTGNAFPVPRAGLHLGRERGDVLFPEDGYVSGLHCRISVGSDGSIALTDLGSSNGSFVRLRNEHPLAAGDILLMGQQLFRVDA